MEVGFSALPSFAAGWEDGVRFLAELEIWSSSYEVQHMVLAESNRVLTPEEHESFTQGSPLVR